MIELRHLVGERHKLPHVGGKFDQAHLVLLAQQGVNEALGRALFEPKILERAAAGVDRQGQVQGYFRLALEDRNLLRPAVFHHLEIVPGKTADDGARLVGHVDEQVHQLHVHAEGGVLGGKDKRR